MPVVGAPEALVSMNRLSPIDSSPALLTKRASWNWPIAEGALVVESVACTCPVGLMLTLMALVGIAFGPTSW